MSATETITDTKTGETYAVETEEQMASDLFPWLRGTEHDRPMTVGRIVKKSTHTTISEETDG